MHNTVHLVNVYGFMNDSELKDEGNGCVERHRQKVLKETTINYSIQSLSVYSPADTLVFVT